MWKILRQETELKVVKWKMKVCPIFNVYLHFSVSSSSVHCYYYYYCFILISTFQSYWFSTIVGFWSALQKKKYMYALV